MCTSLQVSNGRAGLVALQTVCLRGANMQGLLWALVSPTDGMVFLLDAMEQKLTESSSGSFPPQGSLGPRACHPMGCKPQR